MVKVKKRHSGTSFPRYAACAARGLRNEARPKHPFRQSSFESLALLNADAIFLVALRPWETPVPIPNTTVKPQPADDTCLETDRESRWPPRNLPEKSGTNACMQKCMPQETAMYLENFILKNDSIESMRLFEVLSLNGHKTTQSRHPECKKRTAEVTLDGSGST